MDTENASTANSSWARIPLTQGLHAMVSKEDFYAISRHKWTASFESRDSKYYAIRWSRKDEMQPGEKRYKIRMHRVIMGQGHRPGPNDPVVDHINGDSLDNRRENLRLCSQEDNMRKYFNRGKKLYK